MNNNKNNMSENPKIENSESVKNKQFCYGFLTLLNYVFLNFLAKSTILYM